MSGLIIRPLVDAMVKKGRSQFADESVETPINSLPCVACVFDDAWLASVGLMHDSGRLYVLHDIQTIEESENMSDTDRLILRTLKQYDTEWGARCDWWDFEATPDDIQARIELFKKKRKECDAAGDMNGKRDAEETLARLEDML